MATKDGGDKTRGKSAVVVSMADAARDLARQKRRRDDPPPAQARNGVPPGKWTPNNLGLPDECPVTPLGIEGELCHLIDSSGQFRSWTASDFSHAGIQSLFSQTPNWPQWAWPRYGRAPAPAPGQPQQPPPIKSFEDDGVRQALFLACARRGLFSPADKLRGRGAWALNGGDLIYHAGEELWQWDAAKGRPVLRETGMHQGHLYPRLPALPSPWTEAIRPQDNPARMLLEGLGKWHWERPEVDPVLMLGWLGTAYLGGALKWRSAVLLVGDRETGKSTLQDVLKELFGDALFHSADTTAAGIYQKMGHDTRPVAVDELEANADARKVDAVVTLMRAASSGAFARRGGQSGAPTEYQMRSAFLFSAINNPVHASQDLSRLAILRLKPLAKKAVAEKPLVIDAETCGRMVLAILMREFSRFGETFAEYRRALAAGGHTNRGQDTYGTLLAMADLLLGPELAGELGVRQTEDTQWWSEHLAADALPEVEDAKANWRDCLEHLLGNQVAVWRSGARATVGQLLDDLAGGTAIELPEARRELGLTGLGLAMPGEIAPVEAGWVLAVPNSSPLVARLYEGRPWQHGGWKDALRQCPIEGLVLTDKRLNYRRINGMQTRCTLIVMGRYHQASGTSGGGAS
jgi:hypothetical protein